MVQKGIDLIEHLGCTNVAIESVSLEVISAWRGELEVLGRYAATLPDRFTRAHMINGISFHYCLREEIKWCII